MGRRRYSSTHSYPQYRIEASGQIHDPGHFTPEERAPRYTKNKRLSGPKSWSEYLEDVLILQNI
jgi:hypothetical protein